jgi:hypothetical protein
VSVLRLDPKIAHHPELWATGVLAEARWAYLESLCYSTEWETEGRVHIRAIWGWTCADELVAAGLWKRDGDYIQIVSWVGLAEPTHRATLSPSLRKRVYDRDGMTCRICGEPILEGEQSHIDHIIPVYRGGHDDLSNLQLAHASCNLRKGARL